MDGKKTLQDDLGTHGTGQIENLSWNSNSTRAAIGRHGENRSYRVRGGGKYEIKREYVRYRHRPRVAPRYSLRYGVRPLS